MESTSGEADLWELVPTLLLWSVLFTHLTSDLSNNVRLPGGLSLLSALERGPLSQVLLQPLPAQGGWYAAYVGSTWDNAPLALVITAHLRPDEEEESAFGPRQSIKSGQQQHCSVLNRTCKAVCACRTRVATQSRNGW